MSVQTKVRGPRGAMAYGVPGEVFDSSPLRAHPYTLTADSNVGYYVANQGLIISPKEYALRGTDASLAVYAGTAVTCATFGHFIVALTATDTTADASAWAVSTDYAVGDYVKVTGTPTVYYRCTVAHTSAASGTIDTDKFVVVDADEAKSGNRINKATAALTSALPTALTDKVYYVTATGAITASSSSATEIVGAKFIVRPTADQIEATDDGTTATAIVLAVVELNG